MIALLFSLLAVAANGDAPAAATQPTHAPAAATYELSRHVYPVGVRTEAEYLQHLERLSSLLDRHLSALDSDREKIEGRLAYANWILARRTEPFASRVLLGIDTDEDRKQLAALGDAAQKQLDAALELLDNYEPADAGEPADLPDKWESTHETLSGFAAALSALGAPQDASGKSKRRSASVLVSTNVDDPRIQVGVYARLWSAMLLLEAGRADRSVSALSPALAPPLDPLPDFFARWLRVRAALEAAGPEDVGKFAVASSLLYELEEGIGDWFVKDEQVSAAEHTLAFLRSRVNDQWTAAMQAKGQKAAAKVTEHLAEDDAPPAGVVVQLMRIERAAPVLTDERRLLDGALGAINAPATQDNDADDEAADDE